jgi:hypothetical protein
MSSTNTTKNDAGDSSWIAVSPVPAWKKMLADWLPGDPDPVWDTGKVPDYMFDDLPELVCGECRSTTCKCHDCGNSCSELDSVSDGDECVCDGECVCKIKSDSDTRLWILTLDGVPFGYTDNADAAWSQLRKAGKATEATLFLGGGETTHTEYSGLSIEHMAMTVVSVSHNSFSMMPKVVARYRMDLVEESISHPVTLLCPSIS